MILANIVAAFMIASNVIATDMLESTLRREKQQNHSTTVGAPPVISMTLKRRKSKPILS